MKTELVQSLTKNFENYAHKDENGVEFWYARDLQKLLGYTEWRNFEIVIEKARKSCKNASLTIKEHFVDVNKTLFAGNGAKKEIFDLKLTRYACYLIAQNGDPSKVEIAFAQTYFAVQTRNFEVIQQKINDLERIHAREKLAQSEKQLSKVIYERTKDERAFGYIRSLGDKALFNLTTTQVKKKWNVPKAKPLADFAPTVVLKGKDFANEMTIYNTQERNIQTTGSVTHEHVENNKIVRKAMLERGIVPENVEPEIDIKKVERKLKLLVKTK
jgi:DNA-damage-inducible protein D